jgi:transposase-like protein
MPWQETTVMSERQEFVVFAQQDGANIAALCRCYGISRKTGYKWVARAREDPACTNRSRRPHTSPARTDPAIEAAVLAVRDDHPPPAPAPPSCVGPGAWRPRTARRMPPSVSSTRNPTTCGRWTLWGSRTCPPARSIP